MGQRLSKPGSRRWSLPDFSEPWSGRAKTCQRRPSASTWLCACHALAQPYDRSSFTALIQPILSLGRMLPHAFASVGRRAWVLTCRRGASWTAQPRRSARRRRMFGKCSNMNKKPEALDGELSPDGPARVGSDHVQHGGGQTRPSCQHDGSPPPRRDSAQWHVLYDLSAARDNNARANDRTERY